MLNIQRLNVVEKNIIAAAIDNERHKTFRDNLFLIENAEFQTEAYNFTL